MPANTCPKGHRYYTISFQHCQCASAMNNGHDAAYCRECDQTYYLPECADPTKRYVGYPS